MQPTITDYQDLLFSLTLTPREPSPIFRSSGGGVTSAPVGGGRLRGCHQESVDAALKRDDSVPPKDMGMIAMT